MDTGACGLGLDYRVAKEQELSGKFPETFHSFWILSENCGFFLETFGKFLEIYQKLSISLQT